MIESESQIETNFAWTPRQKRLRSVALVVIFFEMALLFIAYAHPFFHPQKPQVMTEGLRKALAFQGLTMLAFYSVCFSLALSLLVIAWLYIREVRVLLAKARVAVWRDVAAQKLDDSATDASQNH